MADNSKKVSELPTAANVANDDRVLVLRSPASNASVRTVTLSNFANSITPLVQAVIPNTTVIANSVTVASNGATPVPFFTYNVANGRTGCCHVELHSGDANRYNVTGGTITIVANTTQVGFSEATTQIGSNIILFDPNPTLVSNNITLFFRRDSATTDNVTVRFKATIY
jgi:hypothetical protein